MNQNISIVRGTTNAFEIGVTDADGNALVLSEGQTLIFGLKRKPTDKQCVLTKIISHSIGEGQYYCLLEPSDTADLDSGRYYYDIGLKQGEGVFYNVIEFSECEIVPNITSLGDA